MHQLDMLSMKLVLNRLRLKDVAVADENHEKRIDEERYN
jgi:hypothetical protein